ncbi:MAG: hypothetical protein AAGH99_03555 [Planctomycetota bacterium]
MPEAKQHSPGPTELYILAAGLLLGILLGPAVLGRIAPQAHAALFGGGPATQQLLEYEDETAAMITALNATGVTPDAMDEQIESRSMMRDMIQEGRDTLMDVQAFRYITFILLAMTACLFVWASSGKTGPILSYLAYGILALGLAVIVARPSMFKQALLWPWS